MLRGFWDALCAVVETIFVARDYNDSYLNSATDTADLERRMREIARRSHGGFPAV